MNTKKSTDKKAAPVVKDVKKVQGEPKKPEVVKAAPTWDTMFSKPATQPVPKKEKKPEPQQL